MNCNTTCSQRANEDLACCISTCNTQMVHGRRFERLGKGLSCVRLFHASIQARATTNKQTTSNMLWHVTRDT